jgi:hypothetical protein
MYKFNCEKCGRVFEGNKEWDVRFTRDEHQEYCKLPVKHKILQIVLGNYPIKAWGRSIQGIQKYLTRLYHSIYTRVYNGTYLWLGGVICRLIGITHYLVSLYSLPFSWVCWGVI